MSSYPLPPNMQPGMPDLEALGVPGLPPPPGQQPQQPASPAMGIQPPPDFQPDQQEQSPGFAQYLPAIAGLGMAAFGGDSNIGHMGAGMVGASGDYLLKQNLAKQRQQLEADQNVIKNVDSQIQKLAARGGLNNPQIQQAIQAYQQSMMDGKLSAKEAIKIQQMIQSAGDIEGMISQADQTADLAKAEKLARINQTIEHENDVRTNIMGQDVMLSPGQLASRAMGLEQIEAADKRARNQADTAHARETERIRQFNEREERLGRQFGLRQDERFMSKLSEFNAAESSMAELNRAAERYIKASLAKDPVEVGLAAQDFATLVPGMTATIGRRLGERGVFTDQDRATYATIISPGLVLTELTPQETRDRLNRLSRMLNFVKTRELDNYGRINPNSVLPDIQKGLPPPPGAGNQINSGGAQASPGLPTPPGGEQIITVSSPEQARALAPGTKFKTPDGRIKIR